MPCTKQIPIDTSSPVLVTGATGYVAGVLIKSLLEKGLTVHGTVRDPSQKDRLEYLQKAADASKGNILFFKGDLTVRGSFADAMRGCSIVFHTASPFPSYQVTDPEKQLMEPAVQGTEIVLQQANLTTSVKRVVLTSSCASMYTTSAETLERPITEESWNRTATLDFVPYALSKTMAELKAWTIAGSQTKWSLVVMNPNMIIGPGLKYHDSSSSFSTVKSLGSGDASMVTGIPAMGFGWVDVRDVADAHVAGAFLPDAQGRHILCGHAASLVEIGKALYPKYGSEYPIAHTKSWIPKSMFWILAKLGVGRLNPKFMWEMLNCSLRFDNSKSKEELGMEYRPLEATVMEMYQQMIDSGAVQKKSGSDKKKGDVEMKKRS
jgi:dihydroflavonol-4-reductase